MSIAVKRAELPASGQKNPIQNALNIHHVEAEQSWTGTAAIIYVIKEGYEGSIPKRKPINTPTLQYQSAPDRNIMEL